MKTQTQLPVELRDVLHALFCLSRDTQRISATTLGDAVALTPTQTAKALVELERQGLVDATRARLTMRGLVLAMQAGSAQGGPRKSGRNAELRAAEKRVEAEMPRAELPVAALPSQRPAAPATDAIEHSTFDSLRIAL